VNAECASPGLLRVAVNEEEKAEFCTPCWQQAAGLPVEFLDGDEVRQAGAGRFRKRDRGGAVAGREAVRSEPAGADAGAGVRRTRCADHRVRPGDRI